MKSSSSTEMGSKLKPFTNFFRTAETRMVGPNQASIYVASPPPIPDGPSGPASPPPILDAPSRPALNTAEGCQVGDKCHFAHDKWELGKPISLDDQMTFFWSDAMASDRSAVQMTHTAKISVKASLADAIINSTDYIRRKTGVTLFMIEDLPDRNLIRSIELRGKFYQVKSAVDMILVLIGKNSIGEKK